MLAVIDTLRIGVQHLDVPLLDDQLVPHARVEVVAGKYRRLFTRLRDADDDLRLKRLKLFVKRLQQKNSARWLSLPSLRTFRDDAPYRFAIFMVQKYGAGGVSTARGTCSHKDQ